MRTRQRRRSFFGFLFWAVSMGGLVTFSAVEFGWISLQVDSENVDADTDSTDAEAFNDGEFQTDLGDAEPLPNAPADPIVFTGQIEPTVRSGSTTREAIAKAREFDPTIEPPEFLKPPSRKLRSLSEENSYRMSANGPVHVIHDEDIPSKARVVQTSNEELVEEPADEPQIPAVPPETADNRFAEIDRLMQSGNYLTAHRDLSRIYWKQPEMRDQIRKRIETTALSIYFFPQPHYMEPYVIQPNDQLRNIASRYQVPWQYLARLNRIEPEEIQPGQKLKVIKGPFSAVVDLSDFEITIHAHGYFVYRYPVGIGKKGLSPIGKFVVKNKVVNPQYTDPNGNVIDADDPTNPLGERWIDLGDSYGIHGTIDPNSIGKAESRGCIRLRNEDVEIVYDLLGVGSEVIIQR